MEPQAIANIYASEIVSGYDIHMPEYQNTLFSRFGDQGQSYFQLLRSLGFEEATANDTYGHFEDNRMHETFHVFANVGAPGPGNDLVMTLDPQDLDATNNFYPRRFDTVVFKNEVTGYIHNIDTTIPAAPVLTIKPNQVADDIGAVVAGEELIISSNAFSEGSGQPKGALSGAFQYQNEVQIIKETIGATGSEMTNQDWFNVTSEGQSIPSFYHKGQIEIDYRMGLRVDGALLFQKRTDNPTAIDPDTNRLIKSTEGTIPVTRRLGNVYPSAAGAFVIDDFNAIDRILSREYAGNYTMAMLGQNRHQNIEDALKDYHNDTAINYARQTMNNDIFFGDTSLASTVNFKIFTKSERTFMFKRMSNFHNPQTYGATGYLMPEYGLFLPLNKAKDPKSKKMVNSLGARYKGLGPYSRRMETWNVGGAGGGRLKVTEFDEDNTYQRAHIGNHNRGVNQFVLVSPVLP